MEKRLIEAAEAGDAGSQCNLGILYDNGVDDNGYAVEGNRPQAVRWLLAAAEQGLPRAQIKLAEVYADGPDIRGSHATACGWFLLAARGLRGIHLHQARSGYARIAIHMTPAQIAKARRFARDWAPNRLKQEAQPPFGEMPVAPGSAAEEGQPVAPRRDPGPSEGGGTPTAS